MKQNLYGLFYDQGHPHACGIALIRTVLENKFGIKRTEDSLIKRAQNLYKEKCNGIPNQKEYQIKKYGTDVYHFKNLAEYYGLKAFSKGNGEIDNLKYLIDNGIWPIVHREFEEDHDGHYVLVYNYNSLICLFDPILDGVFKDETYHEFDDKWLFKNQKWLIFFYEQGKIKIPFKGKYL
jgi:hypothetical protein